jgi:hypothetical protein
LRGFLAENLLLARSKQAHYGELAHYYTSDGAVTMAEEPGITHAVIINYLSSSETMWAPFTYTGIEPELTCITFKQMAGVILHKYYDVVMKKLINNIKNIYDYRIAKAMGNTPSKITIYGHEWDLINPELFDSSGFFEFQLQFLGMVLDWRKQ